MEHESAILPAPQGCSGSATAGSEQNVFGQSLANAAGTVVSTDVDGVQLDRIGNKNAIEMKIRMLNPLAFFKLRTTVRSEINIAIRFSLGLVQFDESPVQI